jgi:SEC-C motif-containing protein
MSECPCLSGRGYDECCGALHNGARVAATAEELMRARYSAFVLADIDFLGTSHDPERRDEFDPESARQWATAADWQGFEVLRTEAGGPGDATGVVEFVARYTMNGSGIEHHEVSEFRRVEGAWYFVDGAEVPVTVRRGAPKVGRNDPCPCGSGRKHKKCCGK